MGVPRGKGKGRWSLLKGIRDGGSVRGCVTRFWKSSIFIDECNFCENGKFRRYLKGNAAQPQVQSNLSLCGLK